MTKSKKIILFTIGNMDHASSRIRAVQYIPLLEKDGYQVKWIPRIPKKPKTKFEKFISFPLGKRWLGVKRIYHLLFSKPDYFFIQKIFIPRGLLQRVAHRGIPFIYDFDDAVYLDEQDKNAKQKLIDTLVLARSVIVSNSILKEFSKSYNANTTIITTPIDVDIIQPKTNYSENEPLVIGWIGSFWTTKYLDLLKETLINLSKEYKIKLRLVGADSNYNIEGVDIEHLLWSFEKENKYLQSFDIGIMPLTSDQYSEAKGGYKLLMYMAAGIPQIASPVGINKEIVEEGKTGFLAENEGDWITSIRFFLDNPEKIAIFGEESRKLAEKKYSREICFGKLLSAIK